MCKNKADLQRDVVLERLYFSCSSFRISWWRRRGRSVCDVNSATGLHLYCQRAGRVQAASRGITLEMKR